MSKTIIYIYFFFTKIEGEVSTYLKSELITLRYFDVKYPLTISNINLQYSIRLYDRVIYYDVGNELESFQKLPIPINQIRTKRTEI